MLQRIILPIIFLLLIYGFWVSPDFKTISAGVAIFLFGMLSLEQGFRAFTGGVLERLLKASTNRRWKSVLFGVVSTSIMQSSSLVSVITISFLCAGLLGLASGIGIVFGANLGTTTGAWLVAGFGLKVKISAYAMPMLVFGVILVFQSHRHLKGIGYILSGLGFLFLGIHYMKEGFEAFRNTVDLARFSLPGLTGLLLFVAIGMLATVIMQSSHATLVLIITALSAQQISYENAIALAIGANVGTTITALLGAMSANEQGKRLALGHLIFNLFTGLVALLLIRELIWAVESLSVLLGIAAQDFTLKLALFHTLFNAMGVMLMYPLIDVLASRLTHWLPSKKLKVSQPRYLLRSSVDFPDTAVEAVRNETLHVYQNTLPLLSSGLSLSHGKLLSQQPIAELIDSSQQAVMIDIEDVYERRIKSLFRGC